MKAVFISNFFNHHQQPFAEEMVRQTNGNFVFVATTPIPDSRLKFGYEDMNHKYDYVLCAYESESNLSLAQRLINEADVAIIGSALFKLVEWRLKNNRLTFCYSERLFRKGIEWYKLPVRIIKNYFRYGRYKNLYLLCAGAYVSADYAKMLSFINKSYKWGYFTDVYEYDIEKLVSSKKKNSMLWAGRFLELKHPEYPVLAAKRLKDAGYDFEMNIIGSGSKLCEIETMIEELGLKDCVHLLGSMSQTEVRKYMEQSEIFMFTSDRNEGWGAVLNESMNSGCAVVASHIIGSVPFLINDGVNGFIYKDGSFDDFYSRLVSLLNDSNKRTELSKNAYKTMIDQWNASNAAKRFLSICEGIQKNNRSFFNEGVCSKADYLSNRWYR